ncbi:TolC family protein [Thauera aminoaromatica]|uniref:TolC family protein n=1 Tax=Thauera aminoaromatica TaxID=164330 RepID=UPI0023F156C6|nr:TolC family protein [Thauera aminoaromatica]
MSLADAVESAWQRTSQSAEVSGQARRALAERAGAGALWAAPPALEVGVVSNRQRAVAATRETEVGIAIPLWLPGQRAARKGQVEAEASAAASNAAAARLRVAGLVREAAAGVALQHAEVAAAQANARELDALAKDVERRVAAGDLARADALSAKAEHLAAVTVLAQARQGLQAAQLRWQALTGLQAVPQLATDVPATRVDEHPAIRAAAVNVELARQRLNVVRTSRSEAPELVVKTRREVTAGEPSINGVGVALRVPFGTASRNEPLMATALSEVELAEATQRELQQQLDADVATARHAADSARQQARDEATRAKLLRERATLIDKSFKAGETPLPELLRAVTAAAQAEAAVSRAQAALAQAASRLQQALGVMP